MTISNAALFKQAHAMTRATIQAGDDYRTTFGACIKAIKDEAKRSASIDLFVIIAAIVAMVTAKFSVKNGDIIYRNNASLSTTYHTSKIAREAMATALPFTAFFAIMCVIMAVLFAVSHAFNNASDHGQAITASDNSQAATADDTSLAIMFNDLQAAIDESGVQGVTIVYSE